MGLWEAGVSEPVGLHDLRHSLASYALSCGLKTVEISRLLRHSDVSVTEAVYTSLIGTKTDQAHALGAALAGGRS